MWTIEYQIRRGAPWTPTGIVEAGAADAWVTWSCRVIALDLVYYAAQAFGPPASFASVGHAPR